MRQLLWLLILVSVLAIVPFASYGQTQQGTIIGTVRDAQGSVVPGAQVRIINQDEGSIRTLTTDEHGDYFAPGFFVGTYRVEVEKPGFEEGIVANVQVSVAVEKRVDVTLRVGSTNTVVTVTSGASVIKTEGPTIDEDQPKVIYDKPMSPTERGPFYIFDEAMWAPGSSGGYEGYFLWGGVDTGQNELQLEGSQNSFTIQVDKNAVDEVSVVTGAPPAEYARASTANATFKSGTNSLHGKFIANFIDPGLNAVNTPFYDGAGPPGFPVWDLGAQGGGPVYIPHVYDGRNKTFWFMDWSRPRPIPHVMPEEISMPTQAMLMGNFSNYPVQPTNPATGQPFPGGIIPSGDISPVANAFVQSWTAGYSYIGNPNSTTDNTSYTCVIGANINKAYVYKFDQIFGAKNTLSVTIDNRRQLQSQCGDIPTPGDLINFPAFYTTATGRNRWMLGDTHIFNPHLVNQFRFGAMRDTAMNGNETSPTNPTPVLGANVLAQWGIEGVPLTALQGYPGIGISGWLTDDSAQYDGSRDYDTRYTFTDTLTYVLGRHTIKGGVAGIKSQIDEDYNPGFGSFDFDGRFTGQPLADFLLGWPGTFSRGLPRPSEAPRIWENGAFAQDQFRATSKLTLSYGFRWDRFTAPYDKNGLYYNFDPPTGDIVVPNQHALQNIDPTWPTSTNPVVLASSLGYPSKLTYPSPRYEPRLGFAYRPKQNGDFVIRGGYGLYSGILRFSGLQMTGPFGLTESFNNSLVDGAPQYTWPDPFPGQVGAAPAATTAESVSKHYRSEYTQTYNVSAEKVILQSWGLRLSYMGNASSQLPTEYNLDTPVINAGPFSQSLRPYPNYTAITRIENGGNAHYNAFQALLHHPIRQGLWLEVSYTWQRDIVDNFGDGLGTCVGCGDSEPVGTQDYAWNRNRDTGPSSQWPTQDFIINYAWNLPFGTGRHWGSNLKGNFGTAGYLLNTFIGGWTVTGLFNAHTGDFVTPTYSGYDPGNLDQFIGRPNIVPGCKVYTGNKLGAASPYINESCFTIPANGTLGDASTGSLHTPGAYVASLNPFKDFHVPHWEQGTFRLGANIYDITNHPHYGPMSGVINTPSGAFLTNSPQVRFAPEATVYGSGRSFFFTGQFLF